MSSVLYSDWVYCDKCTNTPFYCNLRHATFISVFYQEMLNVCFRQTRCRGEVTLQDVEFTYPSRPDATILRGLSVTIKPGQRVALVGQSGCGKSTCMALVERFYDSANGSVVSEFMNAC